MLMFKNNILSMLAFVTSICSHFTNIYRIIIAFAYQNLKIFQNILSFNKKFKVMQHKFIFVHTFISFDISTRIFQISESHIIHYK